MSKYFGTDGFRGEANKALNVEHAYKIGRFLGAYYGREHKCSVVIGKDTRRSGYMFECALTAGLTASGADAYLMHVTTTPSVSYITRTDDFDCGIMISASHNPYFDNGIKLLNGDGEKMEQYVIDEIERYLDGKGAEIPFATGSDIGKAVDYAAGRNRYIGYLISLATHSYKGMRIGLDCANGSTWMMAKSIFETLGAETVVIGNQPNGLNINNDCGSTHIEGLRRLVIENKLDVYECMRKNGHLLGGEQSGHIIFSKYAATGDGLLTAIKLMQAMLANKQPLSVLAAPVKIYPQLLVNVRVSDKEAVLNNDVVKGSVREAEAALGDNGRVLLRKSGTEPVIRVMAEAQTTEECRKVVDGIVDAIKREGLAQQK